MNSDYDAFISHASEDKEAFVRPLAERLRNLGLRVWYDEFSLNAGESLRGSIDRGLGSSLFAVVVLSPAFFSKGWPQWELNGIIQRHVNEGGRRIIPIWHNVGSREVAVYSPSLADIVAIRSRAGVEAVANQVHRIASMGSNASVVPPKQLLYVCSIEGVAIEHADEIHLHVRLPWESEYVRYDDGCGPYGYSCSVVFHKIFSWRLFRLCHFKRITVPSNRDWPGGPDRK